MPILGQLPVSFVVKYCTVARTATVQRRLTVKQCAIRRVEMRRESDHAIDSELIKMEKINLYGAFGAACLT